MKRWLFAFFLLVPLVAFAEGFPNKPVKILVYTKPGGLIDLTARKLAALLEKQLKKEGNEQAVVVENKKGAGGLVAIHHLSRQPADGHTLLALTNSVISKALQAKQQQKLDDIAYLARLVEDYECLIVRKDSPLTSVESLIERAKENAGSQIWVGPEAGGTDHLFAQKFWKVSGIQAKWVPYKSGSEAIAALLGKHADVYVGNPQDVQGRPDLKVLAVASPERLEQFPQVATFAELGLTQLSGESLWRGVVVARQTSDEMKGKLLDLLKDVTTQKEWKDFVINGAAIPIFEQGDSFQKTVAQQIEHEQAL